MTISYFTGFETGDASEIASLGAGNSVQGTTVRTGAYALKQTDSVGTVFTNALSATQSVCRVYWQSSNPLAAQLAAPLFETDTSLNARLIVSIQSSGILQIQDGGATLGLSTTPGATVLSANTWYRIEVALDLAAGGIVKVWINGVLEISTTHSNNVSAAPTGSWRTLSNALATAIVTYLDDIRIDTGTLTPPGEGRTIARQGKTGTPTYNAWTKVGGATAAINWSETPFSATNSCTSITSAQAQTMLISSFSSTQTLHGGQCIQATDTINACKIALIVKEAVAGGGSIRRRLNSADTDTAKAPGTADGYFDDGVWTDTLAHLNAMEAGYVHSANTNLTTVEDVWVIVDFTDSPLTQGQTIDVENKIPAPIRRSRAILEAQSQRAQYIAGRETLPGFMADLTIPRPKPFARDILTWLGEPNQSMLLIAQDLLPNFNAEWKIPPRPVPAMELRGFIKDLDLHLIGKDQVPKFNIDWSIPRNRQASIDLRTWIGQQVQGPGPIPPPIIIIPTPGSGGAGHKRKHRYPEPERSPFEGYTTEQLQRIVAAELPQLAKAVGIKVATGEATSVSRETIPPLPAFDLARLRALDVGAGLLIAELRAAQAKKAAEDEEDELIAMLLLLS